MREAVAAAATPPRYATLWVPRIVSLPLTWSSSAHPGAVELGIWLRERLGLGHCQYP